MFNSEEDFEKELQEALSIASEALRGRSKTVKARDEDQAAIAESSLSDLTDEEVLSEGVIGAIKRFFMSGPKSIQHRVTELANQAKTLDKIKDAEGMRRGFIRSIEEGWDDPAFRLVANTPEKIQEWKDLLHWLHNDAESMIHKKWDQIQKDSKKSESYEFSVDDDLLSEALSIADDVLLEGVDGISGEEIDAAVAEAEEVIFNSKVDAGVDIAEEVLKEAAEGGTMIKGNDVHEELDEYFEKHGTWNTGDRERVIRSDDIDDSGNLETAYDTTPTLANKPVKKVDPTPDADNDGTRPGQDADGDHKVGMGDNPMNGNPLAGNPMSDKDGDMNNDGKFDLFL